MRAPVRPITGWLPGRLERKLARFVWPDPALLLQADSDPASYRKLMSGIYIGGTIKITGAGRHPEADSLLLDNVDLTGAHIVDIGASDGTTSLELIRRLPEFASYTIADLHLQVEVQRTSGGRLVFFDRDGNCILVSGRRFIAWPGESALLKFALRPVIDRARRSSQAAAEITLLNPAVRQLMAQDPRVQAVEHDVFTRFDGRVDNPQPTVIKVANLLRRLYFDDPTLLRGLTAVTASLVENGHLLLVDNPRTADPSPRAGLYQRREGALHLVAQTSRAPELADLVGTVHVD